MVLEEYKQRQEPLRHSESANNVGVNAQEDALTGGGTNTNRSDPTTPRKSMHPLTAKFQHLALKVTQNNASPQNRLHCCPALLGA